jgi:NitT/TauT family transport system substrate-binding protein
MKEMFRVERSPVASVKFGGTMSGRKRGISRLHDFARVLTGAVLATGMITFAANTPSAGAAALHNVRIVIGGGTDFTDASLYYAVGQLRDKGIDVTLSNLADPASALEAVVSGQADIYVGDPMEAAVAVANAGAALQYVGTIEQTTDYEILAQPQFTLSNLAGATIASAGPGTAGAIIANAAFAKLGIDPSTLHSVKVGGTSARVTAILSGQVDLAPVLAPSAVPAVATGKVKILLNAGKILGKYLQEGLITSNSYVSKYPTIVQAVVSAFMTSSRWAFSNEAAFLSVAQANQLTGSLTLAQQKSSWFQLRSANFYATNGAVCLNAILQTERYTYAAGGSLTAANTPKYSSWVNPTFVRKYLKAHKQKTTLC